MVVMAHCCLQGCFQICLNAVGTSPLQPEALTFVQSRCAVLKSAFGLSTNVLPVAAKENQLPVSVDLGWYAYTKCRVICVFMKLKQGLCTLLPSCAWLTLD